MPARSRVNGTPYDWPHRKTRARLLPAAIGTYCPGDRMPDGQPYRSGHCDGPMTDPSRMHLAHSLPVALGGTKGDIICCAACNLGAGAILGNTLRGARI